MTEPSSEALAHERDADAIRAVVTGLFNAIDSGDDGAMGAFYMLDARMLHADEALGPVEGLAALASVTRGVARHFVTTHTFSNQRVRVESDAAEAVTHATVHVLVPARRLVLVRGLRYVDQLVRTADGWRIRQRQHAVLWQFDVDAAEPAALSDYAPRDG